MSEDVTKAEPAAEGVSEDRLRKAEAYVEAEDGVVNRLVGWAGTLVTSIAVTMSLFHLYAAIAGAWPFTDFPIITTQPLRYAHVAFVMMLCFLLFPMSARFRNHIRWWDVVAGYHRRGDPDLRHRRRRGVHRPRHHADPSRRRARRRVHRAAARGDAANHRLDRPVRGDRVHGLRYFGPYLPPPWTHRGYDVSQLVGHLFITLEGIFGIPVDVSSSLIILFTIYGAFLQHSGAGKFFIDFSMALMGRKANSAGRTVVLSSFLLGGPSGSGVATTVTIGAVAYPLMQRGGIREERGRRPARRRRARRHHLAAGAGRRRLPDRRVPQDQLPRRDLDGIGLDRRAGDTGGDVPPADMVAKPRRHGKQQEARHQHEGDVGVAQRLLVAMMGKSVNGQAPAIAA